MRPEANARRALVLLAAAILAAAAAPAAGPAIPEVPGPATPVQGTPVQGTARPGFPGASGAEEIGTWLLGCEADRMTDRTGCRLLHRQPVEPASAGRAALALEVLDRGGLAVPAVTARLTLEGAASGLLALTGTAQLRFPPERLFDMPCGLEGRSVVCAPRAEDARRAAAELPGAGRVLVRVSGPLDGGGGGAEPAELALSRTAEALARLRVRAPEGGASAPAGGLDLRDLLERLAWFISP